MSNYYSAWTDEPVKANTHKVRGVHWSELSTNMKLIRGYIVDFNAAYGAGTTALGTSGPYTSSPFNFDANLGTQDKEVKVTHVNSLRDALDNVNSSWASYSSGWTWCRQYSNNSVVKTDNQASADITRIRAVHVNELRQQLDLVDNTMFNVSPFCGTSCQVGCQTSCQTSCEHACQGCHGNTCHNQMCGIW